MKASNIANVVWNNVHAKTATLSWTGEKRQAILVKVEDRVYIDATHFHVRNQELQHLSRRNYKWIGNELWFDVNNLDSLLDTDFSETRCCEWLQSHLSEIQNFSWKTETKPNNDKQQLSVVKFYDDELLLVDVDGQPYVVMKRLVENMGLVWARQLQKIQDDSRYEKTHIPMYMRLPNDPRTRKIFVLALEMLPTWLMSVNANNVGSSLRDKIIRYQRECSQALWLYWSQGSVVMKRIVENLGMQWEKQRAKIADRFGDSAPSIRGVQMPCDDQRRPVVCLPLKLLPAWLMTITPSKILNENVKAKVIKYQQESYEVLWLYWSQGSAVKTDNGPVTWENIMSFEKIVETIVADALAKRDAVVEDMKKDIEDLRSEVAVLCKDIDGMKKVVYAEDFVDLEVESCFDRIFHATEKLLCKLDSFGSRH